MTPCNCEAASDTRNDCREDMQRVVIIGAGQGGDACAAALRRLGYQGSICLIGDENYPPYQRPPLSKTDISGQTQPGSLRLRGEDFYKQKDISLLLGTEVLSIDRQQKNLLLSRGEPLPYDKLVIATGSRARQLPADLLVRNPSVHTLRSFDDATRLFARLKEAQKLLVFGAGYLGLEVAAVAAARGLEVTVAERNSRILNRAAGAKTARRLQELHEKHSVHFLFEAELQRLEALEGDTVRAVFAGDVSLEADLCVAAIGGTPNDDLARAAQLDVEDGIVVDAQTRTSDPDILAIGDCTRLPFDGKMIRLESVQNAIEQGEIAARTIMGQEVCYRPVARFWSDQFDTKLLIAGLSVGHTETLELTGKRPGSQSVWYFREGALIAVDSINDPGSHMVARQLFANKSRQTAPTDVLAKADNLRALIATG